MNKEVLLALIDKDISELAVLNKSFAEDDVLSPTILKLAKTKAENIVGGLIQLSGLQVEKPKEVKVEIVEQPVFREEIKQSIIVPEPDAEDCKFFNTEAKEIAASPDAVVVESEMLHPKEQEISKDTDKQVIVDGQQPKYSLAEVLNANGHSLNDTLVKNSEPSLANILSNSKIEDLRQALSLAERFRFQRELFNGNGEKLNTTLAAINGMNAEEQALAYLSSFGWNEENKCVEEFRELIHRRFI